MMNRGSVVVMLVLLLMISSCGQSPKTMLPSAEEAETPKTITNYLTEQYKDFPGTKLSILPADQFTYDVALGGWASASKGSWIIASLLQGKPLQAAGMYKSRLSDPSRPDAIDGTLLGEWDLSINARPSRLFKVQTSLGGDDHLQYVLFTGDTTAAYRIVGSIHEDELTLALNVKKSLLSIFYDPERQTGQTTQTSASPCNCPKEQ